MLTITLEMERLRNPYSGLGQYCLHLGHAFAARQSAAGLGFSCLIPKERMGEFGPSMQYKSVKPWHKLFGPAMETSLWHCMHQDSKYLPRNRKTPVMYTIHDLNFLERPEYSDTQKQGRLASMQKRIKRAKGLVYISEYVQNMVSQQLQVPAGMLEKVIYNGGALENAENGKRNTESPKFLFSIGIHPKKNYHVLMPLLAANKEYKWIIAGPDSRGYQNRIKQEAASLGVSDRVEFCGPVDEAAKKEYYQNCSALLFPSLSEGFGLPVVEAMSMGKPVFLSGKTSLPEIGGTEAYYFEDFQPDHLIETFSAGMRDFESDPGKAERLRSWAAQFTWDKAAREYIEFYQELLTHNS